MYPIGESDRHIVTGLISDCDLGTFLDDRHYQRYCSRNSCDRAIRTSHMDTARVLSSKDLSDTTLVHALHVSENLSLSSYSLTDSLFSLVAASIIRLIYLRQAYDRNGDLAFDSLPYAVVTQGQTTLAVLIICSLCLKPYSRFQASPSQSPNRKPAHSKQWSGSITVGGTPYESYNSFPLPITREPLLSIQASMSTPNSPAGSRHSLNEEILLPDTPVPPRSAKRPPRPPPPSEEQRPDLSMFTRSPTTQQSLVVTKLAPCRERERGMDLKSRGLLIQ